MMTDSLHLLTAHIEGQGEVDVEGGEVDGQQEDQPVD